AVLRDHNRDIADVEVHVARGDDVAFLILDAAGRRYGYDIKARGAEPSRRITKHGLVGIIMTQIRNGYAARRDEPCDIVHVPIRMIVEQPRAEPDDAFE